MMTTTQSLQFNQNTSDNLNPSDTVVPLMKKNDEIIRLREKSSIFNQNYIGHSFILGHPTNGVLGVANGVDGEQIVLGEAGYVTTRVKVTNPNNLFRETFRFTHFKDTSAPNTASWNTTLLRLEMDSGTDRSRIYNTVATSNAIYLDTTTFTTVRLTATETKYGNDVIKYFVSKDSGVSWVEVTNVTEYNFETTFTELRFRVIFIGNGANSTYISELKVKYS